MFALLNRFQGKIFSQNLTFLSLYYRPSAGTPPIDSKAAASDTKKKAGRGKKKSVIEYKPNVLDMTWIHPESYSLTHRYTLFSQCVLLQCLMVIFPWFLKFIDSVSHCVCSLLIFSKVPSDTYATRGALYTIL